jgi:transposase
MGRQKDPEDFGQWLADTLRSSLWRISRVSATGVEREQKAVEAASREPRSNNGQVEGHISRPRFLKHGGYGRASFELLLRRRVLNAACVHCWKLLAVCP